MSSELLAPGVQNGEEAQPGSQSFGIGSHLQQGLGYGPKQNAIDDPWILQRQRSQLVGQGEDDVRIRNWQEFLSPVGKPLVACPAVAFGAVPIATRSVLDHLMRAVIALLNELAERGRAARADVPEGFPLLGRQHISPAVEER